MKVYVQRLWNNGELLAESARTPRTPGTFAVDKPKGVPVAHLYTYSRLRADPNLFLPLNDIEIVKASRACMRLRGWERDGRRVQFQEWIVDFSAEGHGTFEDGSEA